MCHARAAGPRTYDLATGANLKSFATMPWLVAFVLAPKVRRRPHWQYGVIRRFDPAHGTAFGLWCLTSHADVTAALRMSTMGSDENKADFEAMTPGVFKPFI